MIESYRNKKASFLNEWLRFVHKKTHKKIKNSLLKMNCCIQCRDESVSPLHSNTFDKKICLKCILVGDEAIQRLYTEAFNYMKIRGE